MTDHRPKYYFTPTRYSIGCITSKLCPTGLEKTIMARQTEDKALFGPCGINGALTELHPVLQQIGDGRVGSLVQSKEQRGLCKSQDLWSTQRSREASEQCRVCVSPPHPLLQGSAQGNRAAKNRIKELTKNEISLGRVCG